MDRMGGALRPGISAAMNASPAIGSQALGGFVRGGTNLALDVIRKRAANLPGSDQPIVGALVKLLGGAASTLLDFAAKGTQMRFQDTQRLGGMERTREQMRQMGGSAGLGDPFMSRAVNLGFMPGTAFSTQHSFLQSIGHRSAGRATAGLDIFGGALAGVDPNALSSLIARGVPGGGASGGLAATVSATQGLAGIAERQMGFRGDQTSAFLQRIAQATSMMAEQGLSLDTQSVRDFVSRVDRMGVRGHFAARASSQMQNIGMGARAQLTSPLQGFAEAAVLADAAQRGGDLLSVIGEMDSTMGDPGKVLGAIRRQLGPAAAEALAGRFSAADAERLGRGAMVDVDESAISKGLRTGRPMPLSERFAQQDLSRLRAVEGAVGDALVKLSVALEKLPLAMGEFMEDSLRDLTNAILDR